MRSVSLHGQGGIVNAAEIVNDIAKLRESLGDYEPCNIYNLDDTGIFSSCYHGEHM